MTKQLYNTIISANIELHSDLIPYLSDTKHFKVLRHPLVYSVPYIQGMNGFLNIQYKHKSEYIKKALEHKNWSRYISMYEKPFRLNAFCDIASKLSDIEYWTLLKDVIICSENIWQIQDNLISCITVKDRGNCQNMMSKEEKTIFNSFPNTFTIYRGCTKKNKNGLSWSLSKDVAKWFANRFEKGFVIKKLVNKHDVLVYFKDRSEEEILFTDVY